MKTRNLILLCIFFVSMSTTSFSQRNIILNPGNYTPKLTLNIENRFEDIQVEIEGVLENPRVNNREGIHEQESFFESFSVNNGYFGTEVIEFPSRKLWSIVDAKIRISCNGSYFEMDWQDECQIMYVWSGGHIRELTCYRLSPTNSNDLQPEYRIYWDFTTPIVFNN